MIKKRPLKTRYSKKRKYVKKTKKTKNILKIIIKIIIFIIISLIILSFVLYNKYLKDLPSVKELESLNLSQASTIYDNSGEELYKIFKEKRTYIPYEEINKNMVNAIVAGEDKRYWDNPGFDIIGLTRAVIYKILGKNDRIKGTSTLTQQLIRNTIIVNEKTIERKVKEIYLAYKLTSGLSKEKILELYLNKISFGHNSYGIEQASKTFFDKSANQLGIMESSVLASLPKGPTYYSPYNHPNRVIGYPYIYNEESPKEITKILSSKDLKLEENKVKKITDFLNQLKTTRLEATNKILICNLKKDYFKSNLRIDNDGCSVIEYSALLDFLNGIKIKLDNNEYIEYQTGRKDFILGRMLEDEYINWKEYKESIIKGIGFKFTSSKEKIKAPHFVFFIKEYLENKYGKDIVESGGLQIYTTLDLKAQEKAEEIVEKQAEINEKNFNAKNAALVSIDNETGKIIAMVGGKDYFDKENNGNVNIITSKLQPGSTFKPFVYSMAIFKNAIGSKTPVYDVETEFSYDYIPQNFDGKFFGKMNISTALNNSRNIPAIKMFYLAGGEKSIVDYMKILGVNSLKTHNKYGAPLALGTGEMTPLELAKAYSVFANMGIKKEIIGVEKIVDKDGNVIEDISKNKQKEEQVMNKVQAYITNTILSDKSSRPEFWNSYLSLNSRKLAAKTGTSTKQEKRGKEKIIYPNNLWTVGYTPNITTVVWAGNTNGEKLNFKGNGLEGAGPIMKNFMEYATKDRKINSWRKPVGTKQINISEVSGLLPSPESSNSFLVNSLFVKAPSKYDNSFRKIKVDLKCNGKITDKTPEAAIKTVSLVQFNSLSPNNPKWENPVQTWVNAKRNSDKTRSEFYYTSREKYINISNIVTNVSDSECERTNKVSEIILKSRIEEDSILSIGQNYIELAYKSNNPIIKLDVLINGEVVQEIKLKNKLKGVYVGNFYIPEKFANKRVKLELRAVDSDYHSYSEKNNIIVSKKDIIPPVINLINPKNGSIKLKFGDYFNLRAKVEDISNIRTINIRVNGEAVKVGITDRSFVQAINIDGKLEIGTHKIEIEAIDKDFNKSKKEVILEIIE